MDLKAYALKSGCVGGVGYGLGYAMRPNASLDLPGGTSIPYPVFTGLATAAGSMVSDAAHDTVIPQLLKSERWMNAASSAVAAGSAVGTFAGVAALTDGRLPTEMGAAQIAGIALASEAIGGYIYTNFVEKAMD